MSTFELRRVIWKTAVVSVVGGLYGVFSINFALFTGIYAESPPPYLGNPFIFQSISYCNAGRLVVCPPLADNSYFIAAVDFLIFFGLCFGVVFAALYKLRFNVALKPGFLGRNSVLISIFLVVLTLVFLSATASASSGASLTEPHWPTPSGVEVFPLNFTLYSGTGSDISRQGSAHMDLTLANYHWTAANVSFIISLGNGLSNHSTNPVSFFECPLPAKCKHFGSVMVPAYSSLNLTSSTSALYFGIPVVKGEYYSISINMTGEGLVSFDNERAL